MLEGPRIRKGRHKKPSEKPQRVYRWKRNSELSPFSALFNSQERKSHQVVMKEVLDMCATSHDRDSGDSPGPVSHCLKPSVHKQCLAPTPPHLTLAPQALRQSPFLHLTPQTPRQSPFLLYLTPQTPHQAPSPCCLTLAPQTPRQAPAPPCLTPQTPRQALAPRVHLLVPLAWPSALTPTRSTHAHHDDHVVRRLYYNGVNCSSTSPSSPSLAMGGRPDGVSPRLPHPDGFVVGHRALQYKARTPQKSHESINAIPIVQGCPEVPQSLLGYISPVHSVPLTSREKVLAICEQEQPIPFEDFFTETMKLTIDKVGEGAFAEVFGCYSDNHKKLALKVVAIEGDFEVNGDPQSKFSDILPEIVISRELSLLGQSEEEDPPNFTQGFVSIYRMGVCKGMFPSFLIDAWDDYDFIHRSDNDRPDQFPQEQLYLVFAAEHAGAPVEDYLYHAFEEFLSIITQTAGALAVAEAALQFEHRDLHRGNVLVHRVKEEWIRMVLEGKEYKIRSRGVKVTIIDYTLSRLSQGECVSYNDLNAIRWVFKGKGDIQFNVYRDMRNATNANWKTFNPYTNVLWLKYLMTKISMKGRLKKKLSSKLFKSKITPYINGLKNYGSARDSFIHFFYPPSSS